MHQPIPDKTQMRSDPLVGAQVGRYALIERIGNGPRGPVYRGRNADSDRQLAIKVLHAAASERELRAASSLGHPGIAAVIDFGRLPDGRHYVVTELLKGEGVDWALRRGPISPGDVVAVLDEVAGTLSAAHQRSLFHGALRPASVFLLTDPTAGTRVKLLDFGVAMNASELEDLGALGALAFTMLTGKTSEPPDPLSSPIAPGVSEPLARLIEDLLKPPELRPQTADEVRARLAPLLPVPPAPAPELVPAPVTSSVAPSPQRSPGPRVGFIAAAVVVIAAVVAFIARPRASEPASPVVPAPEPASRVVPAPELAPRTEPAVPPTPAVVPEREPTESRHSSKPSSTPKAPATELQLEERMSRLEARLRRRPGNADEALFMLNKQRARLGGVVEADERRDIGHQLDLWEQAYLAR